MAARLWARIALSAAVGALISFSAALAEEDNVSRCDGSDRDCPCASPDPAGLPEGCKHERITAAGEQTLGVVRSKHYLARKAWQRQVIDKYGERFQQWEHAACRTVECGPGSISGYSRCTYSAFPCAPDVNTRDLYELKRIRSEQPAPEFSQKHEEAEVVYQKREEERRVSRELGSDEIAEMQRLLRGDGYRVFVDGQFGEQTSEALLRWQHRLGLREDGEPTVQNLELLRHGGQP